MVMAILPVLKEPDPRLRQVASPVMSYSEDLQTLLNTMVETMHAEEGVGLAATQVGILKRILVMQPEGPASLRKIINPEVLWTDSHWVVHREGCLSLPGIWAGVKRHASLSIKFMNEMGALQEELFTGFSAVCLQHEMDHLEGKLFIDRLSPLKRTLALHKARATLP